MIDGLVESSNKNIHQTIRAIHDKLVCDVLDNVVADSPPLYHYTSLQSALSILESGKLRFTNMLYLNDPTELIEGLDIVEAVTNRLIARYEQAHIQLMLQWLQSKLRIVFSAESMREKEVEKARLAFKRLLGEEDVESWLSDAKTRLGIYIFCLSERKDDLRQWLPYADKGHGIALGLHGMHNFIHDICEPAQLFRVSYAERAVKESFLEQFLTKVIEYYAAGVSDVEAGVGVYSDKLTDFLGVLVELLFVDLVACKNSDYRDEDEWRLFHMQSDQSGPLKFQCTGNIIKPYIEQDFMRPSLKEIRLGPCCAELNSEALKLLLGCELQVEKSRVEYRS